MNLVEKITAKQIRTDIPEFRVGDTVRVDVKIVEGKRERIQAFEGLVIAIKGAGIAKNFTVRKTSQGVGVERTFPVNSPVVDKITVVRKGKVRRAKLNYIRSMVKQPKIKEGNRERIQIFEGTIIKKQRGGANETFTVRRVAYGTGVERTFPVNSPKVEKVEVVRKGKVRRAKLYYLRDRVGKATKVKEDIVARNQAAEDAE